MADISNWLNKIKTAIYGEEMRSAIHAALEKINEHVNQSCLLDADGHIPVSRINEIPSADIDVVGGIKPLYSSVYGVKKNRSGLVIATDGTTYVNTKADGGITRDGEGQLHVKKKDGGGLGSVADGLYISESGVTTQMLADGAVTAEKLANDIIATKQEIWDNDGNHLITAQNAQWLNGEDYVRRFEDRMYMTYNIAGVQELIDWIDENVLQLNNIKTYRNKPQRIGTWVDGTPIWRVVIQQDISDLEREDKCVSVSFPVKNTMSLFVTNDYMRIICDSDDIVNDHKLPAIQDSAYDLPSWISTNTAYNKISGWIEFATPESNIRQYTGGGGIPDQEVPL